MNIEIVECYPYSPESQKKREKEEEEEEEDSRREIDNQHIKESGCDNASLGVPSAKCPQGMEGMEKE